MDVFVEQIVKKKSETVDKLKIAGIIVLVFVLSFVCVFILPGLHQIFFSLSFALVAGVVYGAWVLITGMNLEFEYAVTNGDVTVDKIIAKRRRKRLVTVDAKNVEAMGKYKEADHASRQYDKTLMACDSPSNDQNWYMTFRHKTFGNTLLVFSPDERTLQAIKPFLPRQIAMEAFSRFR